MKGLYKKILTLFLTILTVIALTACSKDKKKKNKFNPVQNVGEIIRDDDMELDLFDGLEMTELNPENPNMYKSTYMDVEPDFTLTLIAKSTYLGDAIVAQTVKVTDSYEADVEFLVEEGTDPDIQSYIVSAVGGFKSGSAYTVSIEENNALFFKDRDESIRKVLFTVKDTDKDEMKIKEDIPQYDFRKVTYFDGFGDYDTYMIYEGEFNESEGSVVSFTNTGDEQDIYIKVLSVSKQKKGVYKIYYEAPEAADIFEKLDLHIDNKQVLLNNNNLNLKTEEEIIKAIKETSFAQEYIAKAAYIYNFHDQILKAEGNSKASDFWDKCYIQVSFNTTDTHLTVGVSFSYTITFESGWRLLLCVNFKFVQGFIVSGSAKVDTFLGIPTGVDMNVSATRESSIGVEFRAVVANPKFNPDWMEAEPENFDLNDAQKAVDDLKKKWFDKGAGRDGINRDAVEGDTLLINVGFLKFIIAGCLSIDLDFYIGVKNQANITLGIGYTYSSVSVLVSYSTSSGGGDGGESPDSIREHSIGGSFVGKYSAELFFKVRLSVYITPIKWIICLYVDADAGLYFDLAGLVELKYDFVASDLDVSGAFTAEFGLFCRVTLNLQILKNIHYNWTLFEGRFPALKFTCNNALRERDTDERFTIELTNNKSDSMLYRMFEYRVFDPNALGVVVKNYKYDTEVTYFEMFKDPLGKYKMFGNFTSNNDNVQFVDGYIIVNEKSADEYARISYVYYDISGDKYNDYVDIHYRSQEALTVTYGGKNPRYYLAGDVIEFVEPDHIDGKIFRGYTYKGKTYVSTDVFVMPNNDVEFDLLYIDDVTYTVKYYDGNNQLIYTEEVFNGDKAKGPDAATRDALMESGYIFVCYDQPLDNINCDLEVHAIYTRKGDR